MKTEVGQCKILIAGIICLECHVILNGNCGQHSIKKIFETLINAKNLKSSYNVKYVKYCYINRAFCQKEEKIVLYLQ